MYPYVFDGLAASKNASVLVGGTKVLLPQGSTKETFRAYDEITIPATSAVPPEHLNVSVDISILDKYGQLAFKGIEKLNRIQSMVYDVAYNTNENLLISAPTGAGKTDIAMLTIVHEIKNNIRNDVIKKDAFKIIYMAPKKALAAEMTQNFGRRLESLGIVVRELTGDKKLTTKEMSETQLIVTTPEKWDIVTRKGVSDVALMQILKLLIIDEVSLLHDDIGPVLEAIVARTLMQVENTQSMIRIVGLSATLPNYLDVARFLNVNPYKGLFYFDRSFRLVPLEQKFIGVKSSGGIMNQLREMEQVCYEKALNNVRNGHQVMIFVHDRNATVETTMAMREMAHNRGDIKYFHCDKNASFGVVEKKVKESKNKQLHEMFPDGFGIHHAGMLCQDRTLVESLFADGFIKVLVCTSTLAWDVNLTAHGMIIKGTEVYDTKQSKFVDIGILDVKQIFGCAGRLQYDNWGSVTIITKHKSLSHYLLLLTQQTPNESHFMDRLRDNLNAEVSAGVVTNVDEAVKWFSLTYLYIRMRINPIAYGITYKDKEGDPLLKKYCLELITSTARKLDCAKMIRFVERTSNFYSTYLGQTASNYCIDFETILVFNHFLHAHVDDSQIFSIISKACEFKQVKLRDKETSELEYHCFKTCHLKPGYSKNKHDIMTGETKVIILIQTYISQLQVDSFSLISDMAYISQNAARICRALFEIALHSNWSQMSLRLLNLSKTVDKRLWYWNHPFRQFETLRLVTLCKLEDKKLSVEKIRDMGAKEVGAILKNPSIGSKVVALAFQFPQVKLAARIQPIARNVLRIMLKIVPDFQWDNRIHGTISEPWWIWVEDPDTDTIYHSEYFMLPRKAVKMNEEQDLVFTVPIFEPLPLQYCVRVTSDRWLQAEAACAISFKHLILPDHHPCCHTELLNLRWLSTSALWDSKLEQLYSFTHFNPIQTQLFHTLYYSDSNILLGAPTGSGKTIAAEIAIFRVFREHPKKKVVYIAPLKALVHERVIDWVVRLGKHLGKKVIELTGDVTPDMQAITDADVIVTTPEKWDGVSRSWQTRKYVNKDVALLVIDGIHLLGDDRGTILEVIASRTNFISNHTENKVRIIGLSTALANAKDLADWLNIGEEGLFNFRWSVRPVPLQFHIAGYPGKEYCPRMATMNKPCFKGIKTYSPGKPVLIFVPSRQQTRLTALDLVAFLAAERNPKQWLHTVEEEIGNILIGVTDQNLRLTLSFGIELYHAGLNPKDRQTCEDLFVNQKIQVLIATSALAWGVPAHFPAHLVIVKGTEFYDGKQKRYVDLPITDVLQMISCAGRPHFDDQGYAMILVHDIKKRFYTKFVHDPFTVESKFLEVHADHLNAEIVAGTITSKQDALDYMTWTYFFRRLRMNPTYYGLTGTDHNSMNTFLSNLVERSVYELRSSYCVEDFSEDKCSLQPTVYGRISSYYYLSHMTLRMYKSRLHGELTIEELLQILCDVNEYEELPVRHNEDQMNAELAENVPLEVNKYTYDSPHTKVNLLLQAHFSRTALPIADYKTDTKTVLDQAIRILESMIDASAEEGWIATVLQIINLIQMVIQGRWYYDSALLTLPNVTPHVLNAFKYSSLPELLLHCKSKKDILHSILKKNQINKLCTVLHRLPVIDIDVVLSGKWKKGGKVIKDNCEIDITNDHSRESRRWFPVHADHEYTLKVNVSRSQISSKCPDSKAHTPYFPKQKNEGWFFVVGNVDSKELVALKRVGFIPNNKEISLTFFTPEQTGRKIYTLYIMSDTYLGLDQQYDLYLDVLPSLEDEFDKNNFSKF